MKMKWLKWLNIVNNLKNKDFSKISLQFLGKVTSTIGIVFLLIFFYICFEVYVPVNPGSNETITFTVQKGWGDNEIASNLKKIGMVRSAYFFKFYAIISSKHSNLKAGEYSLSPKMSSHKIASKMAEGDIIKNNVVILEGWNINDIGKYLESKGICKKDYFVSLTKKDYSDIFNFLKEKPSNIDLEGYLFPDTYEIGKGTSCEDILSAMLVNFDQKLTQELRTEIEKQKKSIFDVVTMASIIEKEVITLDDKKIVSGIFWKRIKIGMALQSCATINYITGKNDPGALLKDIQIDSPYNTYKYRGLPKGPISNPGIDSITAAIYPQVSDYWYYLSNSSGKTIFSETLEEHNIAKAKYLGS